MIAFELTVVFAGRPSLLIDNLFGGPVYYDAFFAGELTLKPFDWVRAIGNKFSINLLLLFQTKFSSWQEIWCVWLVVISMLLGLVAAYRRKDVMLGSFAISIALLVAILGIYEIWDWRGTRLVMMVWPLSSVILALAFLSLFRLEKHSAVVITTLAATAVLGLIGFQAAFANQRKVHANDLAATAFLDSLDHDKACYLSRLTPLHWTGRTRMTLRNGRSCLRISEH